MRYTGTPHLVVEVVSSDPARDIIRKAHKYAAAGRHALLDRRPCRTGDHGLRAGRRCLCRARRPPVPVPEVTLDIGPVEVTFDPADLLR